MLLRNSSNILARQFARSRNLRSFEPRVIDALAAAGIRIGFTRDLRINLKDPANSKYADAARKYRALFSSDPRIVRREIVNWNLAEREDLWSPYYLPDGQTQIHCIILYRGNSAPLSPNLVHSDTMSYFAAANSPLYRFMQRRGFESVSAHLAYSVETIMVHPLNNHICIPGGPVLPRPEVLKRVLACLLALKTNLDGVGYKGQMLIENKDYTVHEIAGQRVSTSEHVTRPDFLAEVLERTGFGLIIDIAHLLITAKNDHCGDYPAYLGKMLGGRADRLREIHIAVPQQVGTTLSDAHWSLFGHLGYPETAKTLNIIKYLMLNKPAAQPIYLNLETPAETAHLDTIALVLFLREIMGF
jgi:Protein of unknown function (DUF692)